MPFPRCWCRRNNQPVSLRTTECTSNTSLFNLVENMARVNYGPYISLMRRVSLDGQILHGWKMILIPFHNLNQVPNLSFEMQHSKKRSEKFTNDVGQKEPALFAGEFFINTVEEIRDTYLSFNGWGKGVAFVNNFNIGRYWPSLGPQCNLYVPAPLLKPGKNSLVIFEWNLHISSFCWRQWIGKTSHAVQMIPKLISFSRSILQKLCLVTHFVPQMTKLLL